VILSAGISSVDQPSLSERNNRGAHDDPSHEPQSARALCQPLGHQHVSVRRLSDSGWVVVREDDLSRFVLEHALDHDPRVNRHAIDSSVEQLIAGDEAVRTVEQNEREHFVIARADLESDEVAQSLAVV